IAEINSTYTGKRALHDIKGVIIMVSILSFLLSKVRVAMIAGTLHPKPITNGINDLPCNPILCISLSMIKEARAIHPETLHSVTNVRVPERPSLSIPLETYQA